MADPNVETLKGMFSDMDRESLAALLAVNDNNLERTVEQLLQSAGGDSAAAAAPAMAADTAHDEEYARQLAREFDQREDAALQAAAVTPQARAAPPPPSAQQDISRLAPPPAAGPAATPAPVPAPRPAPPPSRGVKTALPPDFLRVPGWRAQTPTQLDMDEQLAAMLQNEGFRRELASHPEFAGLRGRQQQYQQQQDGGSSGRDFMDDAVKSIQTLGTDVRQRLGYLAQKFNLTQSSTPAAQTSVPAAQATQTHPRFDDGGSGGGGSGGIADGEDAEVIAFDQHDTRRGYRAAAAVPAVEAESSSKKDA